MATPGAWISTHLPKFEKLARLSFISVAPTVMMGIWAENPAGQKLQASALSLPAATEKCMPAWIPFSIALSAAVARPFPPRDMLTTEPVVELVTSIYKME